MEKQVELKQKANSKHKTIKKQSRKCTMVSRKTLKNTRCNDAIFKCKFIFNNTLINYQAILPKSKIFMNTPNQISTTINEVHITIIIYKSIIKKTKVIIKGGSNLSQITENNINDFIDFFESVNLEKKLNQKKMNLPNFFIDIFIRILIKKKIITNNFKNKKWEPSLIESFFTKPIIKSREESLKLVFREVFNILFAKYKSLHYYYWHFNNVDSCLKLDKEEQYHIGFLKYYFGDLIKNNNENNIKDEYGNYTLPNKKNGNIFSKNKSINPKFIKHIFQSQKFKNDFFDLINSQPSLHDLPFDKKLICILYKSSKKKILNWKQILQSNQSYKDTTKIFKNKISGSKAKLPWFNIEIEKAIEIVKDYINKIMLKD